MIYVFHHNDIDGHASAALVRLAHTGKEFSFVECDYSFSLIPFIQEIQQDWYMSLIIRSRRIPCTS